MTDPRDARLAIEKSIRERIRLWAREDASQDAQAEFEQIGLVPSWSADAFFEYMARYDRSQWPAIAMQIVDARSRATMNDSYRPIDSGPFDAWRAFKQTRPLGDRLNRRPSVSARNFYKHFERFVGADIGARVAERFPEPGEKRYVLGAGHYKLQTMIMVGNGGGPSTIIEYNQSLFPSSGGLIVAMTGLFESRGLSGGTAWESLVEGSIERTAAAVATIVSNFARAFPRIVEGLPPVDDQST